MANLRISTFIESDEEKSELAQPIFLDPEQEKIDLLDAYYGAALTICALIQENTQSYNEYTAVRAKNDPRIKKFDNNKAYEIITPNNYLKRILTFGAVQAGELKPAHFHKDELLTFTHNELILMLIYIDRFNQKTNNSIHFYNIHLLMVTGLILAHCVLQDKEFSKSIFAKIAVLPIKKINELQREFLAVLEFNLEVAPEQFDEYENYLLEHGKDHAQAEQKIAQYEKIFAEFYQNQCRLPMQRFGLFAPIAASPANDTPSPSPLESASPDSARSSVSSTSSAEPSPVPMPKSEEDERIDERDVPAIARVDNDENVEANAEVAALNSHSEKDYQQLDLDSRKRKRI